MESDDWHRISSGYKAAADALVNHLTERARITESACIPILFLYRHYIELSLKGLLQDIGELVDAQEPLSQRHPLLPLWDRFRERLRAYDASQDPTWLDRAAEIIAEMDRFDAGSFAFRYPVDKAGRSMLVRNQTVDIGQFQDVIAELAIVLDGASAMLGEHVQLKLAMQSDASDYYY